MGAFAAGYAGAAYPMPFYGGYGVGAAIIAIAILILIALGVIFN